MKKQSRYIPTTQKRGPVLTKGTNPTLMITVNELLRIGKLRDAADILTKEILVHPENKEALILLGQVNEKRSGKELYKEFNHNKPPKVSPNISLCLIARNEEKNIAQCLESYKDFVQEIIVVDTGSTDRTVEIARSFGAEIRYFPWIDDFAAARNVSIENAKGDWILRTDADEWADPAEMIKIQHAAVSGVADVYLCRTISSDSHHPDHESSLVINHRLFRNHKGLFFEHAIHETINLSAIRLGLDTAITNITFHHSGYDISKQDLDKKQLRNLKICESGLERNPNDIFLRMLRGIIQYQLGSANGINEMEKAVNDLPQDVFPSKYLEMCFMYLIEQYARDRNRDKLTKLIDEALVDNISDALVLQFLGEKLLYALGDVGYAIKVLNRALMVRPSDLLSDLLDPKFYNPTQIKRVLVEANLILGDQLTAKQLALELTRNLPNNTIGKSSQEKSPGKESSVKEALSRSIMEAALRGASENIWINLAALELQLGRSGLCTICAMHAITINPVNQEAFNLMGIAALQNNDNVAAQENFVHSLILNPANDISRDNLNNFCTKQGRNIADVIYDQGVNWYKQKLNQNAAFAFITSIELNPDNTEAHELLTNCMSEL